MPIALLISIIEGIMSIANGLPDVIALGASATSILTTGAVTPEQEAAIRAQLDAIKAQIDAA